MPAGITPGERTDGPMDAHNHRIVCNINHFTGPYLGRGDCDMSRRRNGTNRAQAMVGASRYTGYGRPQKKAVSLAELNGHIKNNLQSYYNQNFGGNQDE